MRTATDDPTGFTATELNLLFGHASMRYFRLSLATIAQKRRFSFCVCTPNATQTSSRFTLGPRE
jgi:hypothetical protein